MRRTRRVLAIMAVTLAGCSSQVLPASTPTSDAVSLRLYASTAVVRLASDLIHNYAQMRSSVSFDLIESNYQGALDYVRMEDGAYFLTSHLPPLDAIPLWAAPIGQDGIAIITHPANPVSNLSLQQLLNIYRGRITNWREVGGDDQPIVVISREQGSGTRGEFERLVIGDRGTTQTALIAPSSEAVVISVARQPGSIGYVSMSYLDSSVTAIAINHTLPDVDTVYDNTYPLRVTLFIAGLAEPEETEYRMFIGWMQSPEGQAIIARTHAPLLRPDAEN